MSGFEVAGIVLGAFPIVVSTMKAGTKTYGTVARKLRLFYAFKCAHKMCLDDLIFNQLMFTANLRRLLLPLVVSDERIEELIDNPGGPEWCQQDLDDHLQRHLSHTYQPFLNYMNRMKQMLEDLNEQLKIVGEAAKDKANYAVSFADPYIESGLTCTSQSLYRRRNGCLQRSAKRTETFSYIEPLSARRSPSRNTF